MTYPDSYKNKYSSCASTNFTMGMKSMIVKPKSLKYRKRVFILLRKKKFTIECGDPTCGNIWKERVAWREDKKNEFTFMALCPKCLTYNRWKTTMVTPK